MKVAFISGSHRRHSSIARQLYQQGLLSSWIIENVSEELPQAPPGVSADIKSLFDHHFQKRIMSETRFFAEKWRPSEKNVKLLQIQAGELNSGASLNFLQASEADMIVSYGCNKIGEELINNIDAPFWNCHGGLSPWYKGVATHFWPSFMMEPQMTGMTLHETSPQLDGGGIIHQTSTPMVRGDGIHDLSCRAVDVFAKELPRVIKHLLKNGQVPQGVLQKTSGKLWKYSDWRPEHLYYIYNYHNDSIVDKIIDGEITGRLPNLISIAHNN